MKKELIPPITGRERSDRLMGDLETVWIWQEADLCGKPPGIVSHYQK